MVMGNPEYGRNFETDLGRSLAAAPVWQHIERLAEIGQVSGVLASRTSFEFSESSGEVDTKQKHFLANELLEWLQVYRYAQYSVEQEGREYDLDSILEKIQETVNSTSQVDVLVDLEDVRQFVGESIVEVGDGNVMLSARLVDDGEMRHFRQTVGKMSNGGRLLNKSFDFELVKLIDGDGREMLLEHQTVFHGDLIYRYWRVYEGAPGEIWNILSPSERGKKSSYVETGLRLGQEGDPLITVNNFQEVEGEELVDKRLFDRQMELIGRKVILVDEVTSEGVHDVVYQFAPGGGVAVFKQYLGRDRLNDQFLEWQLWFEGLDGSESPIETVEKCGRGEIDGENPILVFVANLAWSDEPKGHLQFPASRLRRQEFSQHELEFQLDDDGEPSFVCRAGGFEWQLQLLENNVIGPVWRVPVVVADSIEKLQMKGLDTAVSN